MRYPFTLCYIIFIVVINYGISYAPSITVFGSPFSSADMVIGVIYVFRDFAQREIKHYVIVAMAIGGLLSYLLADKTVAIASVTAFSIGELVDWAVYTFTKRPLSKRILLSASLSSPIDTGLFLFMISALNSIGYLVMLAGKLTGVIAVWYVWRLRERSTVNQFGLDNQQVS